MNKKGILLAFMALLCSPALFAMNVNTPGYDELARVNWQNLFSHKEIFFIGRVGMGLILGMLTGLSHDLHNKNSVGLRTYGGVSLGSAAFTATATYLYLSTGMGNALQAITGVTTGIGFLCAAVIFKEGTVVKGLSTAASLWATAAIGEACGAGLFAPAIGITFVVFCFHFFPRRNTTKISE